MSAQAKSNAKKQSTNCASDGLLRASSSSGGSGSVPAISIRLSSLLKGLEMHGVNRMVPQEFADNCFVDPSTCLDDYDGDDQDVNFLKGFVRFQIATATGDGKANKSSKLYEHAVRHFKASAEKGHIRSQYMLGVCYVCGLGVVQNRAQARIWLQAAAEQGQSDAHCYLGLLMSGPRSSAREQVEAMSWFEKSLPAQEDDANASVVFFMKAAKRHRNQSLGAPEQGNHNSRNSEGLCLACHPNFMVVLISKLLPRDHSGWVQLRLGLMYFLGIGVLPSSTMARRWWKRGVALGNLFAQDQLEMLPAATKCDVCEGTFDRIKECSRCYSRAYCSTACQKIDWKAGHKSVCESSAEAAAGRCRCSSKNDSD